MKWKLKLIEAQQNVSRKPEAGNLKEKELTCVMGCEKDPRTVKGSFAKRPMFRTQTRCPFNWCFPTHEENNMRVKRAVHARKRKKAYFEAAKGYRGGRSRLWRTVKDAVERSREIQFSRSKSQEAWFSSFMDYPNQCGRIDSGNP